MRHAGILWATLGLALLQNVPAWAEPPALESGEYRVTVRLELPHLDNVTTEKTAQICLSATAGTNNHGIAVLSDNNPLAHCPISNLYEDAGQITFDIFCEGKNSARAKAYYTVKGDRFTGQIVMQMGGKNMTMTEVQSGHRIGACDTTGKPAL